MSLSIEEIVGLFTTRGQTQYGREAVNQLEHALQCAQLAEHAGETQETIVAALLHDLGHLLADADGRLGDTPSLRGIDDLHQFIAVPFLRGVFSSRLIDAVQWHVDAKRYLCATRPGYLQALSADSQRSLALQGGVFSDTDAAAFIARPHAADAVRLRLWDDQAKVAALATPPLSHYLARAERCLQA